MAQELKRHIPIIQKHPSDKEADDTHLPTPVIFDQRQETYEFPDAKEMNKHLKYLQAFDLFLKLTGRRNNTHLLFSPQNYPTLWEEGLNIAGQKLTSEAFTEHLNSAYKTCDTQPGIDEVTLGMAEYFTPELHAQFLFVQYLKMTNLKKKYLPPHHLFQESERVFLAQSD